MTGDRPRIVICGLGPGGSDHITAETRALLESDQHVFLRTSQHPNADLVDSAESFDHLYRQADTFDEVYDQIVDALTSKARQLGSVVYAVPGSPLVLERSVRCLMGRTTVEVEVEVKPAMSFLDVAWARLGIDPVDDGVRLVDGHRFATEAADQRGPLLVAHAHAEWVLSAVKLAVEDPPDQPVVVLQRLGTADEHVVEVEWHDLDRIEADHLTTLFIPQLASPAGAELALSIDLMTRLREQCPWDRRQDHGSLRKYLREEAYEVLDALDGVVDADDDGRGQAYEDLESELGDLWFQILFHCRLAAEQGQFTVADVAATLTKKMVERHPHVFDPDAKFDGSSLPARPAQTQGDHPQSGTDDESDLAKTWEAKKAAQSQRQSIIDGIPSELPSLALADKVLGKAIRLFGRPEPGPGLASVRSLVSGPGTEDAGDIAATAETYGRLLLAMTLEARAAGVDLEHVLRQTVAELMATIRRLEAADSSQPTRSGDIANAPSQWVVG